LLGNQEEKGRNTEQKDDKFSQIFGSLANGAFLVTSYNRLGRGWEEACEVTEKLSVYFCVT
jgi:hypothetical protein